jgi:glutamyl-tRNA reductase
VKFVLVGLSHQTAPVEIREQVFVPEAGVGECVRRLIDHDLIESGILLSTCNRTELYAVASQRTTPDRLLESFGLWPHALPLDAWRRYAYQLHDEDAVAQLFRVASGLDSMVIGEAQILGQIKRALVAARQAGGLDARLEIIARGAIRAAKRTRHETGIGRRPVSVSHAAVAAAASDLGALAGRSVLLIGAGEMSLPCGSCATRGSATSTSPREASNAPTRWRNRSEARRSPSMPSTRSSPKSTSS